MNINPNGYIPQPRTHWSFDPHAYRNELKRNFKVKSRIQRCMVAAVLVASGEVSTKEALDVMHLTTRRTVAKAVTVGPLTLDF